MTLDLQTTGYSTILLNNTDKLLVTMTSLAAGTFVYGPFYNPKEVLRIAVNLTAVTGSATVSLLLYDQSSGASVSLLTSAALSTAGLSLLTISPYIAPVANVRLQSEPAVFYQIQVVVATGPVTGTIGAHGVGQ